MNVPLGGGGGGNVTEGLRAHLVAIGVWGTGDVRGDRREALMRAEATVGALGSALARLHRGSVPPRVADEVSVTLPSDLAAAARRAVADGKFTPASIDVAYRHMSVERLVRVLEEGVGAVNSDVLVLSHGSPTMDRLRGGSVPDSLAGWDSVTFADPHLDLAIAARDVIRRLGPAMVPVLAGAYGASEVEPQRLDWYSLAIELAGLPVVAGR